MPVVAAEAQEEQQEAAVDGKPAPVLSPASAALLLCLCLRLDPMLFLVLLSLLFLRILLLLLACPPVTRHVTRPPVVVLAYWLLVARLRVNPLDPPC